MNRRRSRAEESAPLIDTDKEATVASGSDSSEESLRDTTAEDDGDIALINTLPQEVLLKILSFLDVVTLCRCAQVCKAWYELALDGSNWQRVDLFNFQRDVTDEVVEGLAHRGRGFLRALNLDGCRSVKNHSIVLLAKRCNLLEELILKGCPRVTDRAIKYISNNCPSIQLLDLSEGPAITDQACAHISTGRHSLRRLYMAWCTHISSNGIRAICNGCPQLESLNLLGCSQLDDDAFKSIGASCPRLRHLNLSRCVDLTNNAIISIANGCPDLEHLCLSHCGNISNSSLRAIATHCTRLRTLEVAGCHCLSDTGFIYLCERCPKLSHLDLEECSLMTDVTLQAFSQHCPDLQQLTMSCCHEITDAGISHLFNASSVARGIRVLELDNCPQISDVCLPLFVQMASLVRLELYDCPLVTREAIHSLQEQRSDMLVHIFFQPIIAPETAVTGRRRRCRCCNCAIL